MSGRAPSAMISISAPSSTRARKPMRRIGIDVGGTNTDAVLLEDGRVAHAVKTPTTPDVTTGIVTALAELTRRPEIARGRIDGVVNGTTHFVNAVVQRRALARVAAVRIGLPASASLPPFCDWPADLAERVRGEVFMIEGGHDYDGRPIVPFDEIAMPRVARQIRASGIRSVAIAAIFSPLDPGCEERARAILVRRVPGCFRHNVPPARPHRPPRTRECGASQRRADRARAGDDHGVHNRGARGRGSALSDAE